MLGLVGPMCDAINLNSHARFFDSHGAGDGVTPGLRIKVETAGRFRRRRFACCQF